MENNNIHLTENDQKILKKMITAGRISDTIIAKDFHLSQQAVQKIRTKLEEKGIIKGYAPIIDFKKINIRLINIVGIKVSPVVWQNLNEQEVSEKLVKIPYIFRIFRVPNSNLSYILIMGYKDIEQRDRIMKKLETIFSDEVDVIWTYSLSIDNLVSDDPTSLLYEILDDKYFRFEELFLSKKQQK